jgi:Glyoxalase-like domain
VSDSIKFGGVTLDCRNAGQLAAFYAAITGGEVAVPGEARVLAAGATKYEHQPNDHCRVYADPAGHPFCLSTAMALQEQA